jgi:hypothetical protein
VGRFQEYVEAGFGEFNGRVKGVGCRKNVVWYLASLYRRLFIGESDGPASFKLTKVMMVQAIGHWWWPM